MLLQGKKTQEIKSINLEEKKQWAKNNNMISEHHTQMELKQLLL